MTNRFGRRLFLTFFKTYTEKVWGIPCSELKAEWAAQRIKDLSLKTALLSMFLKPRQAIKTLIEEFDYPRLGPGMMWQAVAEEVAAPRERCASTATWCASQRSGNRIDGVVVDRDGRTEDDRGHGLHLQHAGHGAGPEARSPCRRTPIFEAAGQPEATAISSPSA